MKIELLYLKLQSSSDLNAPLPDDFDLIHQRFVDSYLKFKPTIAHDLTVVLCNGEKDETAMRIFANVDCTFTYYNGGGWDIGAYQAIGKSKDCDLLVCCNSQVHFWKEGWLDRLVEAFERHGLGVYSPMASYEASPHLRTSCIAFSPRIMREYPHLIDSRAEACFFEHGAWNFSEWAEQQGYPVMMVTWDAEYPRKLWRVPPNIFRRGDQSNCLVWDRHTKIYNDADPVQKASLKILADGGKKSGNIEDIKLSRTCQIQDLKGIYKKYFHQVSQGTFVEVGAFDGETYSNSSCLADIGWNGVYVEPVREFAEKCLLRHQQNSIKVYNHAIGEIEGELEIEISDAFTTASQSTKLAYSVTEGTDHLKFITRKILAVRLEKLLVAAGISSGFELLIVGVEGFEKSVFRSFDLSQWLPKMIIIELCDVHPSFQDKPELVASAQWVRELIVLTGYREIYRDHINTIFVLTNCLPK